MRNSIFVIATSAALLSGLQTAFSDDNPQASNDAAAPKTIKSTYLITGLHCPPCTTTVERSVKGLKGVKSVKVDWATKNARIEFDEQQVTAQQIAGRIGATSHMMGGNMKYSGWLALKVPEIADAGNAEKAKAALTKIQGVSTVATYPKEKSVGVSFSSQGSITTSQLVEALKEAGLESSVLP